MTVRHEAVAGTAKTRAEVLVSPEWLAEHLTDPAVRVVDVDVSPAAYEAGHIPGAVPWNVYRDLKDTHYQLVDSATMAELVGRSGITPESTVVCYGYAPALAFWLLRYFGHADVRLLDCGRDTWRDEGRPWTARAPEPDRTRYPVTGPDPGLRATTAEVLAAVGQPGITVADVRSAQEYRGERFWPSGAPEETGRAGRVPGAVHVPLDGIYDERGAFRSAEELRAVFGGIDLADTTGVLTYCTIGARACTAWFVLTYLLDRPGVRVYDGSWADWGHRPDLPIE